MIVFARLRCATTTLKQMVNAPNVLSAAASLNILAITHTVVFFSSLELLREYASYVCAFYCVTVNVR